MGLKFERLFTVEGEEPASQFKWVRRDATIKSEDGSAVFEQKDIEVPEAWSANALNITASKYFRGVPGTPQRENSVRRLIARVADTITNSGDARNYFATTSARDTFRAELTFILLNQMAAFNSPVWFNVGAEDKPQCSACFINSVEDSMGSILDLAKTEGMLFKYGSGTGSNLSVLRSSKEMLRGGGMASGPVSFMKGFDSFAGVIKSGGKTRRAAKMVILNVDHPDILKFISCKMEEEKKAHALIDAGFNGAFNDPDGAYGSVQFQNANHSVRVTDAFMDAVATGAPCHLRAVSTGEEVETLPAARVFQAMAEAAHACGDPGIQFDTEINNWHTCTHAGRIHGSNPCSEYMFLDDSACNLASINLMKFRTRDLGSNGLNLAQFEHAVQILITAMEILVSFSSYPTERIAVNSLNFRPLGLGYANLGAFLMSLGLPYDSAEGRDTAALITALMHHEAYAQSATIARDCGGPFPCYEANKASMQFVMGKHASAALELMDKSLTGPETRRALQGAVEQSLKVGKHHGWRNAQATVLAPTGTIAFMMDCDTTGIEPDLALVKTKKLVGGGTMKVVNRTVALALDSLGYRTNEIDAIKDYITEHETIEDAPGMEAGDLPVFDCSLVPAKGKRSIAWQAHITMMAACQPFISGAISKTVNMPATATVDDVKQAYQMAWKMGVKALAIYRDGCKRSQPLNAGTKPTAAPLAPDARRRLPDDRDSKTHKFSIAGHEGYLTVGLYDDGSPGEVFIKMAKEGSTISGLMDAFGTVVSISLQYGVPLEVISSKLAYTRFEPSGWTRNDDIKQAHSVIDYIARWLDHKFLRPKREPPPPEQPLQRPSDPKVIVDAGMPCHLCGSITIRAGSCHVCPSCGTTTGCG